MILVIGDLRARPDGFEEALRLSREHVARSRVEPGCLSHDVHLDPDDPARLVFVERWEDRAALNAHFAVLASRQFAAALGDIAAAPPKLDIYEIAA